MAKREQDHLEEVNILKHQHHEEVQGKVKEIEDIGTKNRLEANKKELKNKDIMDLLQKGIANKMK